MIHFCILALSSRVTYGSIQGIKKNPEGFSPSGFCHLNVLSASTKHPVCRLCLALTRLILSCTLRDSRLTVSGEMCSLSAVAMRLSVCARVRNTSFCLSVSPHACISSSRSSFVYSVNVILPHMVTPLERSPVRLHPPLQSSAALCFPAS